MEEEPIFQEEDVFSWLLASHDVSSLPPDLESSTKGPTPSKASRDFHNASFSSLPLGAERFNWAEDVFLEWPETGGESSNNLTDSQFSLTPAHLQGVETNDVGYSNQLPDRPVGSSQAILRDGQSHAQQRAHDRSASGSSAARSSGRGTATAARNRSQTKASNGGSRNRTRAPLSPRSLAQREKNREAVRNCRKRKKEHAQILKERSVLLEEENSRLRLQLQLGSEEMQRLKNDQGEELLREMIQGLSSNSKDSTQLAQLNQKYMSRLIGHGRDRQAAIQYILSRLNRMLQPARPTKMYLWQMAQDDSFFDDQKGGIWQALCRELELTDVQQSLLKTRRPKVVRLRSDIANAIEKLNGLQEALRSYYVRNDGSLYANLARVLEPRQLSSFFQLATDPKSILNTPSNQAVVNDAWERVLEFLDEAAHMKESATHSPTVGTLDNTSNTMSVTATGSMGNTTGNPSTSPTTNSPFMEGSPSLLSPTLGVSSHKVLQTQRERILRSLIDLFTLVEDREHDDPRLSDDCVLFDPNNGGQFEGKKRVLQYIKRIGLAFSGNSSKEDSLVAQLLNCRVGDDKGRATWMLTGTYNGKLRNDRKTQDIATTEPPSTSDKTDKSAASSSNNTDVEMSGVEKVDSATMAATNGATETTEKAQSAAARGKRVSFKVVVAYKFAHKSDKIVEMVVSWDALSLMRQLRLLPPAPITSRGTNSNSKTTLNFKPGALPGTQGMNSTKLLPSTSASRSKPIKLNAKGAEDLCRQLRGLFEAPQPKETVNLASQILDSKCCFHDSNMGGKFHGVEGCLEYIERLRGPFPNFRVKTINITPLGSPKAPRIQMGWAVEAMYGGALVSGQKQCEFNGVFFITFSPTSHKISQVQMSWNATTLMLQLGVIAASK